MKPAAATPFMQNMAHKLSEMHAQQEHAGKHTPTIFSAGAEQQATTTLGGTHLTGLRAAFGLVSHSLTN